MAQHISTIIEQCLKEIKSNKMNSLQETIENTIINNVVFDQQRDDNAVLEYESVKLIAGYITEEMKDNMIEFAKWLHSEGYIYVGEGDYLYPDADGLISSSSLAEEFLTNKYKQES